MVSGEATYVPASTVGTLLTAGPVSTAVTSERLTREYMQAIQRVDAIELTCNWDIWARETGQESGKSKLQLRHFAEGLAGSLNNGRQIQQDSCYFLGTDYELAG